MAASSSSLSLPLQLLPCGTSFSRVGILAIHRPSPPSIRLQPARGRQSMAAVSYHEDASAGHGDGGVAAASSVVLRQVVDDAAVVELRAVRIGRAPQVPMGRPAGKPKEGGGGSGGKIHAAPTSAAMMRALRLPKEGSGGQGGSIN
ncbi:unnamed protein product [Urochloa humidicola]